VLVEYKVYPVLVGSALARFVLINKETQKQRKERREKRNFFMHLKSFFYLL
jgi:hypothetical protein